MNLKTKPTESHIQAVLMRWVMNEKHHNYFIPNSNQFFNWEADLLSFTKAGMVHEFEIKLNVSDYKADAKKRKHFWIGEPQWSPAYFWYVTYAFEIDPPEKAGWIIVTQIDTQHGKYNGWKLEVKKEAPKLNNWKVDDRRKEQIGRILAWRLCNIYENRFLIHHLDTPLDNLTAER